MNVYPTQTRDRYTIDMANKDYKTKLTMNMINSLMISMMEMIGTSSMHTLEMIASHLKGLNRYSTSSLMMNIICLVSITSRVIQIINSTNSNSTNSSSSNSSSLLIRIGRIII